jgi:membrane-associated phospholipid phosphatase
MEVSHRIDGRLRMAPPALVACLFGLASFAVIAAVLILMGFLITRGPLHAPIIRWDQSVTRWFASQQTDARNTATSVGSTLGMTQVIIGIELLAAIVLAIVRRWRDLAFLMTAVALEASVAFTTSFVVDRPRPSVIRLDVVPPTRSFPSGHTAAAIALYVGLAIIITPHVRARVVRIAIWTIALLVPVYVGVSRVYRGMHHATDVIGSLILGVLALTAAWALVAYVASVWRRQQPVAAQTGIESEHRAAEVTA